MLSQSNNVLYLARAISFAPLALGIHAIARPGVALSMLQFPTPAEPESKKLVLNLMRIYGARTFALGLGWAIPAWLGDRRSLAWYALLNGIVALVDGFVSRDQIGTGEWNHWGAVPIGVGIWAVLMGFFDKF